MKSSIGKQNTQNLEKIIQNLRGIFHRALIFFFFFFHLLINCCCISFMKKIIKPSRSLPVYSVHLEWTGQMKKAVILLWLASIYQPLIKSFRKTTKGMLHHLINIHKPSFSSHWYTPELRKHV